jgi:hypothetical protein
MSRNRLIMLIAGTLGVLVIGAAGFWTLNRPAAVPAAEAGPAPTGYPWVVTPPSGGATTPAEESAAPASSPAGLQATENPGGEAEPFVQTFADQPGVKPLPKLPSPKAKRSMPAFADGCDHGYGDRNQCIPLTFPDGTADKCDWLAERGFTKIAVNGEDRHKLDPDGNGIACDN